MNEPSKKKIIVLLLLASCLISAYLLFMAGGEPASRIERLAEVDSLLQRNFNTFHIQADQIDSWHVTVDSTFQRRIYKVSLPGSFSKTQLHAEIHRTFRRYGMEAPSRVIFPQRDMEIQIIYRNTVVRTVSLRTDPEMVMNRNLATIMVAFGYPPSPGLQQQFRDMGESLFPVMAIRNPMQAGSFRQEWDGAGGDPIVWLRSGEGTETAPDGSGSPAGLQQLESALPDARVLDFQAAGSSSESRRTFSRYSFDMIPAGGARILQTGLSREEFIAELDAFAAAAGNGERPLLIVNAAEHTLTWLRERLPEYKKGGLTLVPPPEGP